MPDTRGSTQTDAFPPKAGSPPRQALLTLQTSRFWLILTLSSTLCLYLISSFNDLLYHVVVEIAGLSIATAIFLVGWNTRRLVNSPTLLILATGFLCASLVDLLHTLADKELGIFPGTETNLAIQFWIAARYLTAAAFGAAALSLKRRFRMRDGGWQAVFLGAALLLTATIWPLGLFPDCFIEGVGLTRFKVFSEYLVAGLMACAGLVIWSGRDSLTPRLTWLLLLAILFNILSGLSLTLYHDPYSLPNFAGHLFKLATVVVIYAALVRGTLRDPYNTLFRELNLTNEHLGLELERRRRSEADLEAANQELALLYRIARALHSTPQLDVLSHLILATATAADGGGFTRALLFTVNLRAQTLQGMLGLDRQGAHLLLPPGDNGPAWENPRLNTALLDTQRFTELNRTVIKQRLVLDAKDNPLARAYLESRVVLLPESAEWSDDFLTMVETLDLGSAACVPLLGRKAVMGVLVVEAADVGSFPVARLRFLEMFARQAGEAMENARLLHRLEQTHEELRDVQERLIEGEKLSVLGEMAAQVAHELKNPLVSIGGFAQRLAKRDLGDAQANEYATIIAREVRRLEEMLGNILGFSKKQLVCLEDCDLPGLVAEVLALEQDNLQRQGIKVHVETGPVPSSLTGDCRQLRQVLHNLLINARQAMPRGGEVFVRMHSGLLRGDQAVFIEIEDTGGGIPPEIIRNIFNPFFSTRGKGTGLGLSISHRIVAHHHGEIEVVNSARGARFIVRLPVTPPLLMF